MNREDVKSILISKYKFSPEDVEKLSLFHDELITFNKKYNLISKSTESVTWYRHILDSAQIVDFIGFEDGFSVSDMGSGAGFPGIVLSIFNKNSKFHVKLYEKSNIKCDFLDNVRNKLDLKYEIFGRYQDEKIASEYIVCRAFKKIEEILRISREIVEVSHKLVILKGKNAEEEINKLQKPIEFMYRLEKSITDPKSKILIVDVKK